LEEATQIYQKSTCDISIKQAVEHLFEGYQDNPSHGILNLIKHSRVDDKLVNGAVQIALNNFLCMDFYSNSFYLSTRTNLEL
jgi:hypothetical protein